MSLIKHRISISEPPVGGVRGNIYDSSSARGKAHSRLPIDYIIKHFSVSLRAEALIRGNCPLLKRMVHFGAKY